MRSRREFIGSVAVTAGALSLAPGWALAEDTLALADYTEMLKTTFFLANADGTASGKAKLVRIFSSPTNNGLSQFSLKFRGNAGVSLPEGMYLADNWAGLPQFDIHIIPVGVNAKGRELYMAHFAHLA
jgi:Domain of unknown function (DUF6916)